MILDAATKKIELVLGGAVATNQLPFTASWADITTTGFTPGSSDGVSNGGTAVDLVAVPGASTQRVIKNVNIYNADTTTATVTVRYNNNGTTRVMVSVTLQVGDTLRWTMEEGWECLDSTGRVKTTDSTNSPVFTGTVTMPATVESIATVTAAHTGTACPLTATLVEVTTDGDSDEDNLTLANGTPGQILDIICKAVGNAADTLKITPTTMLSGTNIKFTGSPLGSGVRLVYTSAGWAKIGEWGTQMEVGTTTTPPVKLQAGTNNTTAQAGAMEYDGTTYYFTPVASNRGVNMISHFTSQNANWTGANGNSAQPVFNTDRDVITLPGSTAYFFEGVYHISTTGTTSHQTGVLFGGTATLTSIGYLLLATQVSTETFSASNMMWAAAATVQYPFAAVATATYSTFYLRGIVRINAGGTLIPQFQFSATPGAAPTIYANSFFRLSPIGANTVSFVGNIA